jgi:hypothetical protein
MKRLFLFGIASLMSSAAFAPSGFYEGYLEGQRKEAQLEELKARTALINQCTESLRATGRMPDICAVVLQQPPPAIERKPQRPPNYYCAYEPNGVSCWPTP